MRNVKSAEGILRVVFAVRAPIVALSLLPFLTSIAWMYSETIPLNPTAHQHNIVQRQSDFVDFNGETHTPSRERPSNHFVMMLEPLHALAMAVPIHFGVQSFESPFIQSSFLIRTLYTASQL